MEVHHLPLADSGLYGKMMLDYIEGHPQLRPYYSYSPALSSFPDVIEARKEFPFHRETLADEMLAQHQAYLQRFPVLSQQIEALRSEQTFTVTTGHQLCLATGPLYFIYKIITTIHLCRQLAQEFPAHHFVPVYWMASEDHDIEEINHFHLFSETLKWETKERGRTGRLPTAGIGELIQEVERLCGNNPFTAEVILLLKNAYEQHPHLSAATRELVLTLFGEQGLLVIDADRPTLKKLFAHVISEELTLHPSFEIVNSTTERLAHHYKTQLSPREINLFYLEEGLRERIVKDEKGHYHVLNTDLDFSREFILDLVEKQPERFSPNVVLRPLYQETILPNIAYVGGPGEIAYWMQLKEIFAHYNVFFPMLVPRNNALVLPARPLEKFLNLGFERKDVFRSFDDLSKQWLSAQEDLSSGIHASSEKMQELYNELTLLFTKADPTLAASVQGELQKVLNGLENLGKKGNAALKRKHEVALNQLKVVLDKVSPAGHAQERHVNFIQFYSLQGPSFIEDLMKSLQPMVFNVAVFTE
ncbi:MAG: bacillithiol biosynthesis cysteine-adding enzyme BshC [Bacteroidetes bacterium]|nr:bacillithiol biosynthesis cysteine-adding enzyme BshC [Bacteroidota bacterium]